MKTIIELQQHLSEVDFMGAEPIVQLRPYSLYQSYDGNMRLQNNDTGKSVQLNKSEGWSFQHNSRSGLESKNKELIFDNSKTLGIDFRIPAAGMPQAQTSQGRAILEQLQ